MRADVLAQASLALRRDECRNQERRQQERELHAREHRQARQRDEEREAARARSVDGVNGGRHSGEHERIRDGLGNDEARQHKRRGRQAQHRRDEREARAEAEPSREQEHRDRGERHERRIDRLHRSVAGLDASADEPGGRGQQRLEQRQETDVDAADGGARAGGERPAELAVHVFVREVRGCRALPGHQRPDERARRDDERERRHGDGDGDRAKGRPR